MSLIPDRYICGTCFGYDNPEALRSQLSSRCKCPPPVRFHVGEEVGVGDEENAYYLKRVIVQSISEFRTEKGFAIYTVAYGNISFAIAEPKLYAIYN